jgi:single-stranded-DNA-specific exonuclease
MLEKIIEKIWTVAECDEADVERLTREAGVSPLIARLLVNRGITEPEEAKAFLSPRMEDLHDPYLMPDMEVGVKRIVQALEKGEKILVHGDYDVDGITSAALLIRALKALKADVVYRVPHRQRDGYDIKPWTADEAKAAGVSLIITTDCGVTATETIKHATSLGIDVVVTDHHEQGTELPPALAVINPKRHDSQYPFKSLAGVGVAFKLAQALVRELGYNEQNFQKKFLDLVALGTVSDVVPLIGENRIFVKYGLETLPKTGKTGLQTLLKHCKLLGKPLSAYYLGFVLAPRINAVGRMDDSALALLLFLTSDETEAGQLVDVLEHLVRRHGEDRGGEEPGCDRGDTAARTSRGAGVRGAHGRPPFAFASRAARVRPSLPSCISQPMTARFVHSSACMRSRVRVSWTAEPFARSSTSCAVW